MPKALIGGLTELEHARKATADVKEVTNIALEAFLKV